MDLISVISDFIVPILSSLVVWFFTKRYFQKADLKKLNVEIDSSMYDTLVKHLDVYKRIFLDLDQTLAKKEERIKALEIENILLKERITALENK